MAGCVPDHHVRLRLSVGRPQTQDVIGDRPARAEDERMHKIVVTRRTLLRTALATSALAGTGLAAPFVRQVQAADPVVPKGKLTLGWHSNIASRWLDPQQHDGTATPDNFLFANHDALIKNL